jgi:serine/threonine protein phosphatase 1
MVLNFLRRSRTKEAPLHFVPEGERVYAIGDIHGRIDLLDDILDRIAEDDRARGRAITCLVFLGDLIDRGPDSSAVVDRLLRLREGPYRTHFLLGNHEEVFLKVLGGDLRALRFLLKIGGRETILSYGFSIEEYHELDFDELLQKLIERVPPEHHAFLKSFENWADIGDYRFVHAGVRPGVPVEEQTGAEFRWIREEFLRCRDPHDKMIVHGHTISEEVDERSNRIGIDTGAYRTGRLTAMGLEGGERWFLQTSADAASEAREAAPAR